MSSEKLSKSSSSISVSASGISANHSLDLVLVPANSHNSRSTRRQVHSGPTALESTPMLKNTLNSGSTSSLSDTSDIDSTTKSPSNVASAYPGTKGEKTPKSKAGALRKPGLDWGYQNVYATRSGHGKATLGTASGAPKGCELM